MCSAATFQITEERCIFKKNKDPCKDETIVKYIIKHEQTKSSECHKTMGDNRTS